LKIPRFQSDFFSSYTKNLPFPAGSIWIIQNALRVHYLIVRIDYSIHDFEIMAALLAAVKLSRISAELIPIQDHCCFFPAVSEHPPESLS